MALRQPDPRYTLSRKAQGNFRLALRLSLVFIGALWLVFIIDQAFGLRLGQFGRVAVPVAGSIALTVAAVPTGMKAGVRISPRGVEITPTRARPSVA